jgi:hypothetical protein
MTNPSARTIEVQSTASADERRESMRRQTEQILDKLRRQEDVAAARTLSEAALAEIARLHAAHARVMKTIQEVSLRHQQAADAARQALIEDRPASELMEAIDGAARAEAERRNAVQAGQWLVERLLPEAEIRELAVRADYQMAQAMALRIEAGRRIERTAKLMTEAAEFEGLIAFDPAETLSGALTARAEEMERDADHCRRQAADRADRHQDLLNKINAAPTRR